MMRQLSRRQFPVKRLLAIAVLAVAYGIAVGMSRLTRSWHRSKHRHRRIVVNGTFHNPNWFHAHITPLVQSGYGEVILVCDEPIAELHGLRYRCPPDWVSRLVSRAGAKAFLTLLEGIRHPADIYVGYHIFPSAITALVCARILGAKCVYQVTSGQLELEGGGWNAENRVLVSLGRASALVERLALRVAGECDLAVVRGSRAARFLEAHGVTVPVEMVTGSVQTALPPSGEKDIDVAFVGRLTEYKRPDRLIEALAKVAVEVPRLRAIVIGDGPDRAKLEAQARALGVTSQVEFLGQRDDVPSLVARAKIFVLTSRWEGVSIAMLEAMAMGAVPVVSDVGDLRDFVQDGITGYVVQEEEIEAYARRILTLLRDTAARVAMATAARDLVVRRCDREVLAARWRAIFDDLLDH